MSKTQSYLDMINAGATPKEANAALALMLFLRPSLRIKVNGRIDTIEGDKTTLGLYRTLKLKLERG
jgi:hypothetical protein